MIFCLTLLLTDPLATPPEFFDETLHGQQSSSNRDKNLSRYSASHGSYGSYAFSEGGFYHYP